MRAERDGQGVKERGKRGKSGTELKRDTMNNFVRKPTRENTNKQTEKKEIQGKSWI